ncbi:MAG: efflux RND transporter permease subunit [Candidatus Aminicenantes bacterium]|nr:efflux RND transporter permease subunit [Candidatus Aminicenantes bacterium]
MNLPEFAIKKPVSIIVAMLIFITIGVISILKLPLEMMPDTSFPGLMVQIPYPSSSPEEVERIITRPLEDVLATINNLESLSSTSSSSSSNIHMQFKGGTNMDLVTMEIRDKIDLVRNDLPDDIENIRIRRFSFNDRPVINFSLALPGDLDNLYYWSENYITQQLERIQGVANVDIRGIRNKVLTIYLKPEVFYSSSIRITDLISTIRNNNINISAGYVEEGPMRYVARVPGELKILEDVKSLPVSNKGLTIADVARVTYDYPVKEEFNRLDGNETVRFQIYRASNANIVDVCNNVKDIMASIKETEPELQNMNVIFYRDQSEDILRSLKDLTISGIIGGLMAVFVLLFFLRKFRSTIIIAIAIPMAIVFTFSLMYLYRTVFSADITINIISLSGLMMAVGMLVDNSVVVLENIFRLRQEKQYSPLKASITGASEVAMAVTASTLTTLVVFISLSFMSQSGFGRFLKDFALTISLALIASLIVSLSFIPLAGSRLLAGKAKEKARWLVKLTAVYERIISFTIKNWKTKLFVVGLAVGIFFTSFQIFKNIEQEYMATSDEREIDISVYMPRSFTLEQMKVLFKNYEEILLSRKEELSIKYLTTEFGVRRMRQGRFSGGLELALEDKGMSVTEIKERLKELLPIQAGITYEYAQRFGRGGHHRGITVELIGLDYTKLTELAPMVIEKLRTVENVEDVTSDLEGGDTQIMVEVDRQKAESSGVSSQMVARTISSSLSERPIGKFKTENREIDIILKIRREDGFSEEDLRNISLPTQSTRIPVSAVSNITYRMGSTSIRKENKQSKLMIRINTKSQGMMGISNDIGRVMNTIQFPDGYSWSLGSGWRRFQESQGESGLAIILALIFIYIIMASLFESFVHPLTILMTVPLALFGVAILFSITNITLNTTSYLGLLVLFGIVVNNGIILIDHIRILRKSGMGKNESIVQGGKDRMRPIVMTAITTIFGVLPLALPFLLPQFFEAVGRRAQMWAPISVAIIGGLTTSTFFTLIFLPTFYSISDSVTSRVKSFLGFKNSNI